MSGLSEASKRGRDYLLAAGGSWVRGLSEASKRGCGRVALAEC